ncbi:hypothetical protein BH24ACT3_BH24ACT3_08440 [soil metagenome]
MSENKKPVDHALDLFVFAPLGFALEARSLVPKLVERGRQQMDGQVTMAKMVGQFAVQQGQSEAGKALSKAQASAATALEELGLLGKPAGPPAGPAPRPAAPTTPSPSSAAPSPAAPVVAPVTPPAPEPATPGVSAADVATLAIPDYDSLAASQVVPRMAGLATEELEAVRAYESAKRGRKTILNRIDQLQSA